MTPPDAPDAPRDLLGRLEKVAQGSLEEAAAWGEISGADILALVQRVRTAEAETARLRERLELLARSWIECACYSREIVPAAHLSDTAVFENCAQELREAVGASRPGEPQP